MWGSNLVTVAPAPRPFLLPVPGHTYGYAGHMSAEHKGVLEGRTPASSSWQGVAGRPTGLTSFPKGLPYRQQCWSPRPMRGGEARALKVERT